MPERIRLASRMLMCWLIVIMLLSIYSHYANKHLTFFIITIVVPLLIPSVICCLAIPGFMRKRTVLVGTIGSLCSMIWGGYLVGVFGAALSLLIVGSTFVLFYAAVKTCADIRSEQG